jgi:hypothetical protein
MSKSSHSPGFELPYLHAIEKWLSGTNNEAGFVLPGWGLAVFYALLLLIFFLVDPVQSARNFDLLFFFSPIWMPILLVRWTVQQFVLWRRTSWTSKQKSVLLELKIPRNIYKSPLAMEAVLATIHLQGGEGTWLKRYVFGRTRNWTSFELVSLAGEVHFYVWTRVGFRRLVETAFYAQYPEIEIIEAIDYSRLRDPSNGNFGVYACEYVFRKPQPYPLKTYVDYGLERPQLRQEKQVNPFANLIELFGSLGPGEQMWTQFIIRHTKKERYYRKKNASGSLYEYKDEVQEVIESLKKGITVTEAGIPLPTPGQTEILASVERNSAKLQFDVGIRSIYSAPPENYYPTMSAYTVSLFRPFNSLGYNELGPGPYFSEKFNDYPWEDIGGFRQRQEMREAVHVYRRRSYFHPPYRGKWNTMSSEELATLCHIPNTIVKTPTLRRTETATGTPPLDLPK